MQTNLMTHTNIFRRLALCAALIMAPLFSVQAQDAPVKVKKARWYQINVTFFQQKHDRKLDESFKFEAIKMTMADTMALHKAEGFPLASNGINAPLALHHENLNGLSFTEQDIDEDWIETLSKLDPVTQPILFNSQWVQPVYNSKYSLPVYFESSQDVENQSQVKGLFHLYVSRYLHSKIELQFLPKGASSSAETISLEQSRRMRSKEVHYLDHPLIGALIRILPYEHPLTTQEKLLEEKRLLEQQSLEESALNARI